MSLMSFESFIFALKLLEVKFKKTSKQGRKSSHNVFGNEMWNTLHDS